MCARVGIWVCMWVPVLAGLVGCGGSSAAGAAAGEPVLEVPMPAANAGIDNGGAGERPADCLDYARRYFGSLNRPKVVYCFESYLADTENPETDVYTDLAMAYLTFGKFDSAIAVLEKGRPNAGELDWVFAMLLEEANKVKSSLTQARDALRAEGEEVEYPAPEVFAKALSSADPAEDFLLLNLADAFIDAHPDSRVAMQCLAELNLGFVQRRRPDTKVPQMRGGQPAQWRGRRALEKLQAMDPGDPYPSIRYTDYVLFTLDPRDGREPATYSRVPEAIFHGVRQMDNNPRFTDKDRAYLTYGLVMVYVLGTSWEVEIAESLVDDMEQALALDPGNALYESTLVAIRNNVNELNRTKTRQRRAENQRSAQLAQRMFGGAANRADRSQRGEEVLGDLMRGFWNAGMEEIGRDNPAAAEALQGLFGCPGCWGMGRHPYSGDACYTCGGDGDTSTP